MVRETPALAPCAYRRVHRGQTFCSRGTDEFDRAVWPQVCARCPVPAWLEAGICEHLDIGTEVGRHLGAESPPRVYTACRFFNVRLDGLERCQTCPEFSLWEEQEEKGPSPARRLVGSMPRELLEEAVQDAVDRHVLSSEMRLMPRCFRAGVAQCIRSPELVPNWVMVIPPASLRQAEAYRSLVGGILKEGGLEGMLYTGPLKDVDSLCDLCLIVQQCPRLVIDVSEWDPGVLFAIALGGALGRQILMIRSQDSTPPFVPQGLPIDVYATAQDLAVLLVQGLRIQLPAAQGEEGPAEAPPEEEPGEAEGAGEVAGEEEAEAAKGEKRGTGPSAGT